MRELFKPRGVFGVHSVRHVLLLVSVFCLNAPPSARALYDPPCLNHNFTWTTQSGKKQKCAFLNVTTVNGAGREFCSNPLPPLAAEDVSQRPPAAMNVQASYYTFQFVSDGLEYVELNGIWSGLNITFQLGLEAARKVRGVLFSMRCVSPDSGDYAYGKMHCRAYDFGFPLTADALLDQQGKPLQLYFDCFRGQRPGNEYEYTIRTLPVVDSSGADPNDTVITFRYRAPSCFSIPGDHLCKDSVTRQPPPQIALCSYWKPQYFIVTANYTDLTILMELGPEECSFDAFRFKAQMPKNEVAGVDLSDGKLIQVDAANISHFETFAYDRNITYIKVELKDISPGKRVVMVEPLPSENTCFRNDASAKRCSITQSAVVTIIKNPCLSGPCSSFEVCQPNGEAFTCLCKTGYIRDHPICVENPCEVLTDLNATHTAYNPCDTGNCTVTVDKRWYTCSCPEELAFVEGTCKVHPCMSNPCGRHGTCEQSDQSRGSSVTAVPFVCNCDYLYYYNDSRQSCEVSGRTLAAVILLSTLCAALLFLLLLAWRQKKSPLDFLKTAMPCLENGGNPDESFVDPLSISSQRSSQDSVPSLGVYHQVPERTEIITPSKRIKTVIFNSNGHPLHEKAVHQLAVFLQANCMCDVILPAWCIQDIARRGQSEWITFALDSADKVILLCSKESREAWQAHSGISPTPADIFTRAVSILLRDATSVGLPDRCCVAYLDYSSKNDIPPPLAVGAVYRLMKHMDALFFRLHDTKQGSADWNLRVSDLEEENYAAASPEGADLRRAIQQMREFQLVEPNWYERFHSVGSSRGVESQTDLKDDSEVDEQDYDSCLQRFSEHNGGLRQSSFL